MSKERNMSIRYFIAAALMASACAAHADVQSGSSGDPAVKALYDKVRAEIGNIQNVTVKQGDDAVYVSGLSTAQALSLAGDGMSVIATTAGFKIVQGVTGSSTGSNGGGAAITGSTGTTDGTTNNVIASTNDILTVPVADGTATAADLAANVGAGTDNGSADIGVKAGNKAGIQAVGAADAADVPEPASVALMLAGVLGIAGLRRRAR
jgi:hypothetical protein